MPGNIAKRFKKTKLKEEQEEAYWKEVEERNLEKQLKQPKKTVKRKDGKDTVQPVDVEPSSINKDIGLLFVQRPKKPRQGDRR